MRQAFQGEDARLLRLAVEREERQGRQYGWGLHGCACCDGDGGDEEGGGGRGKGGGGCRPGGTGRSDRGAMNFNPLFDWRDIGRRGRGWSHCLLLLLRYGFQSVHEERE